MYYMFPCYNICVLEIFCILLMFRHHHNELLYHLAWVVILAL